MAATLQADTSTSTEILTRQPVVSTAIKNPPQLEPVTHAIRVRKRWAKRLRVISEGYCMTVIASEAIGGDIPQHYPPRAAVISWIFFDWAAQPYFTLITTFVFA